MSPIVLTPTAPAGLETITWVEPDGTEHALLSTSTAIGVLLGQQGRFSPENDFIEDTVPQQPGSRLRSVVTRAREVDVPLLIQAADPAALRTQLRAMTRWFDPTRGDGRFRVTGPGGDQRELICRKYQGMQMSEDGESSSPTHQQCVVTLRAFDPFWYDVTPTVLPFTIGTPPTFFPFFPLRLTSSTVFSTPTINNPGDADAYPVWTITGPGSGIALVNQTTNQRIELSTILSAGDVLEIDTRPGVRTVYRGVESLFADIVDGSWLWWLVPGDNLIRLELSGASVASAVQISFVSRYLTV